MSEEQAAQESVESAPTTEQAAQVEGSAPSTEQAAQVEESAPSQPEVSETQKRINQLTREKYDAQRQSQAMEQRLQQLEQAAPQPAAQGDIAPKEEDFYEDDDPNAYQKALAKHEARQEFGRLQQQQVQQVQLAEQQRTQATYNERVASFAAKHPDFTDSVGNMPLQNGTAINAIFKLEQGPDIAYHLSKNLDVVDRLNQMDPEMAAVEVGIIAAKLKSAPPPKPTTAPDPIDTIAPGGAVPGGLEKYEVSGATFE